MDHKDYVKYYNFITRYTHLSTTFDRRSYQESTLSNHINLTSFKTKFSLEFLLEDFYKDFTTVTDYFTTEVLSHSKFYDYPDIENAYKVLKAFANKTVAKIAGFDDTQLATIKKAFNIMDTKFNTPLTQAQPTEQPLTIPSTQLSNSVHQLDDSRLVNLERAQLELSNKLDSFMETMLASRTFSNTTFINNNDLNKAPSDFESTDSIKVTNLLNKKLRYENHLKNANLLTNNNKVFTQLSNKRIPGPFFSDNTEFVESYNLLIANSNQILWI